MAERWWWELKRPITDVKPGEDYQLKVKREAIPIIFLPGIMGSRLKQKKGGKKAWDPDSDAFMFLTYGLIWQRGGKKKKRLVGDSYKPDFLEVHEDDKDHNKKLLPPKAEGEQEGPVERGWGGVMWSSYGTLLEKLADRGTWRDAIAPVGLFFDLPVYACGYNWTADVTWVAEQLAERINAIIKKHEDQRCRQVILVSHSMGGIVARATCALPGVAGKVLGVVHGVQPVHGSGAAYWRMKGGFERETLKEATMAWVLGTDGEEVTQTLAEMPGGLALLPNRLYGKEWLEFYDLEQDRVRKLPASNPYTEIYNQKEPYWRLVNPDWLIGPSKIKSRREGKADNASPASAWDVYMRNLGLAETAHAKLEGKLQHAETHFFSGTGLPSAGAVKFERAQYFPGPDEPSPVGLTYHRNGFVTYVERGGEVDSLRMSRPGRGSDDEEMNKGDGTVPLRSAHALKSEKLGASHDFTLLKEEQTEFKGMAHQTAFSEDEALKFTANAIRKLCLQRMKLGGQ